jgi:hypothetical protein
MAVYFSTSKIKNIKIIPYSLCIIAFLTSFGPWGAFSLSERSQLGRIEEILVKNNILVNGKIVKTTNPITEEESQDVSSVVQFFSERKALDKIQPWFDQNIDTIKGDVVNGVYKTKEAKITDLMGIEYELYKRNFQQNYNYFNWSLREFNMVNLKGYDYMLNYRYAGYDKEKNIKMFVLDSNNITVNFNPENLEILLKKNDNPDFPVKIDKFIDTLKKAKSEPVIKDLSLAGETEKIKYNFVFMNISGEKENEKDIINFFHSYIFLKIK